MSCFFDEKRNFTGSLSTNGAVMVSNGLAYSLVIEGAAFWDQSKVTYRPLYPAKFINHKNAFWAWVSHKNQVFDMPIVIIYDVSAVRRNSSPGSTYFCMEAYVRNGGYQ